MTVVRLQPHQCRVCEEREELFKKLEALRAFISAGEDFDDLPRDEQFRMKHQERVMSEYLDILEQRIDYFCDEAADRRNVYGADITLDDLIDDHMIDDTYNPGAA